MKTVFIDIDGTLLNSRNSITKRTKKALQDVYRKGHIPVLCSGRCLDGLASIIGELSVPMYASTLNGACIFDRSGKIISSTPLSLLAVVSCMKLIRKLGMDYLYFFSSHWGADGFNACYELERRIVGSDGAAEPADVMAARTEVHKFLAVGESGSCIGFLEEAKKLLPGCSIVPSSSRYVEVNAPGIDKGFAVRTVCSNLGSDISDSICFGDYDNDLSMFAVSGYAVAMGNAPEHVKNAADEVCPTNDEDGLAIWLEKNLLQA